jgi:hypothetical protein
MAEANLNSGLPITSRNFRNNVEVAIQNGWKGRYGLDFKESNQTRIVAYPTAN